MNTFDDDAPAVRINASLMANYLHAKAILVGFVTRTDSDGKRATIKTTDDQFIQVIFAPPLNFMLQPNQLIECYGTVSSSHQFQCSRFAHFMPDVSAEFSSQFYNKFIKTYLTYSDRLNIQQPPSDDQTPLTNVSNNFKLNMNPATNQDNHNETMNDFDSWN